MISPEFIRILPNREKIDRISKMTSKEWDILDHYNKLEPCFSNRLSAQFRESSRVKLTDEDINYDLLHETYLIMADIINNYGEVYLPIFKRLDKEMAKYEKNNKLLEKAKKISSRFEL